MYCYQLISHYSSKGTLYCYTLLMDSLFFDNLDLNKDNSLIHLLDDITDIEIEIDEATLLTNSPYYDLKTFSMIKNISNPDFLFLSLNCQSIRAKFDLLQIFIEQINKVSTISVISLQETWLTYTSESSVFNISNYMISQI